MRRPGLTLIQAFFDGVIYNKVMMPGAPTSGIEVDVYDSTQQEPGSRR